MRAIRKDSERARGGGEKGRGGEDLDRVPGFWLSVPQMCWQVVLQNVTEEVKCLTMFPRGPLDCSPHATSHFWVCTAEPKGHTFEKKKNKNKPCCSLRREEGAVGCWGRSHERLRAVGANFPAAAWHSLRWGFHLLSPVKGKLTVR